MVTNKTRLINVGLHGATLCTRFLLIFFLAKYLDPASVGYYGLFTAAVGYSMYFVGLDFYTYLTREVIKYPVEQRGQLVKSQAALSAVLYLIFWPFAVIFLYLSGWPTELMLWFFPILIFEHFNQETYRFLIAMSEPITASIILFIRQGSWAIIMVALMSWDIYSRNLQAVMAFWAVAGAAAAAIGVWKLRQLRMEGWRAPVNWGWIKQGVSISLALLLATLALRGMQTIDRYWIEALGGIEMVGAYVVLLGVAGTLLVFLDAGVFAFAYPVLIKLSHIQDRGAIKTKIRQMLVHTLFLCAAFSVCSWLALPHLIGWIGNPIYLSSLHWYPWLLFAMVLNALSMVPHYALYASGNDKHIIYSHITALFVFVATVWVLGSSLGALAVPLGLNSAFAFILVWKAAAYWLTIARFATANVKAQIVTTSI